MDQTDKPNGMGSESDSENHFRLDQIPNTDFYFDAGENDNFNDFVQHHNDNNNDSNEINDINDIIDANDNNINMNLGMGMGIGIGMNMGGNLPLSMGMNGINNTDNGDQIPDINSMENFNTNSNNSKNDNNTINSKPHTNTNINTDINDSNNNSVNGTSFNNSTTNNSDIGGGTNIKPNISSLNADHLNIDTFKYFDDNNNEKNVESYKQNEFELENSINSNNNKNNDDLDLRYISNFDDDDLNLVNDNVNFNSDYAASISSSAPTSATTAIPPVSFKQKSSPRRSIDKRRTSISIDDNNNQQKRTRASGEILEYLMNEFSKNSNPTTSMRREISNKTGMPERSVRIWFQNRRAKARKMEKLNQKDGSNLALVDMNEKDLNFMDNETNSDDNNKNNIVNQNFNSNEKLSQKQSQSPNIVQRDMKGILSNMNSLPMEINGKYYLVECKSLSVGNWQRIRAGYVKADALKNLNNLSPRLLSEIMSTTDLLVIVSKKDQEINYFFSGVFQNQKVLFRIFYPLMNILKCSLLNQTQQMNSTENYNLDSNETLLQLELGVSPQFAVHFLCDPNTGKQNANQWSICEDFSEGQQVASAYIGEGGTGLPHMLTDDLNHLKYLNTLITSLNKSTYTPKSSSFPGPTADSHVLNQNQFSPLNHPPTSVSTPLSINNIMGNYSGFPQNSFNMNMNDNGELLNSDLLYTLDNSSALSGTSLQQHSHPQSQNLNHQLQQQFQQLQQPKQNKGQDSNQSQYHHHQQHYQQQQQQPQQQQQQKSLQQNGQRLSLFQSQVQKKKIQQRGTPTSTYNGLEGMFNPNTVDSDTGEGKLESSGLDLFRHDHNELHDDALIKGDDDDLDSADQMLLTEDNRDGLMNTIAPDDEFIKQDSENFFLDDGINGLGF